MKIILLILSVSVLALNVFADEKLTVRSTDTGESFEISVHDNLRIYEINSNWLDSVPYLIEHAKWMEPWAYEALGDCYRNGTGGVEKSMVFALNYYKLSGKKMGEFLNRIHEDNPDDELGLFTYFAIRFLDGTVLDFEGLNKELSRVKNNDYKWLHLIRKLSEMNKEKFAISDLEPLMNENSSPDECLIIIGLLANQKLLNEPEDHPMGQFLMDKLSGIYTFLAEHYFEKFDEENPNPELLIKSLEYYKTSDNNGVLSKKDIKNILYIKEILGIEFYDYFTSEDLTRFEKLTKREG